MVVAFAVAGVQLSTCAVAGDADLPRCRMGAYSPVNQLYLEAIQTQSAFRRLSPKAHAPLYYTHDACFSVLFVFQICSLALSSLGCADIGARCQER